MPQAGDRWKLGPLCNPVRAGLHGPAALAALALGLHFGARSHGAERRVLIVFAVGQFLLFTVSTLYHAVPWRLEWKRRMQRLDHSAIYLQIAASLTPITWVALADPWRWAALGAAWGIAWAGIAQKLCLPDLDERASIPVQVLQACVGLPAIAALADRAPGWPLALAVVGTGLHALGALVFVTERPRLWPRVFSFHELFHVLVVAGSGTHWTLALHVLLQR